MLLLDQTFPTPAENLACDEALLDWREESGGAPILRFWESKVYFVALGYTNKTLCEVNVDECTRRGIEVLRRCSGGGTVLQGAGCFNYALILPIENETAILSNTNRFVMERNRAALSKLLNAPVAIRGHTDLAWDERKFSGNAQRRKRRFTLFHGTFLLDFDLPLLHKVLCVPLVQPEYRNHRAHLDFVRNINSSHDDLRAALQTAWRADEPLRDVPFERIQNLAATKYADPTWNEKF